MYFSRSKKTPAFCLITRISRRSVRSWLQIFLNNYVIYFLFSIRALCRLGENALIAKIQLPVPLTIEYIASCPTYVNTPIWIRYRYLIIETDALLVKTINRKRVNELLLITTYCYYFSLRTIFVVISRTCTYFFIFLISFFSSFRLG